MKKAYTLLELMVTLFILAMLVSLGVPVYIAEMNKSRVGAAMSTLEGLEQAAKAAYEENQTNSSLTYGNTIINSNTLTNLNNGSAVNVLYIAPGGNANVSATQFLVCVYVGGLNFSGYVAPTNGTTGSYARICMQDTASEPIYTNKCGSLENSSLDVPTKYLPTGCNCANIWGNSC